MYFPLSPKEKSRHTVYCMEQAWLYQFVDFRRDQRPAHGLTLIHPYNAPLAYGVLSCTCPIMTHGKIAASFLS